MNTSSVKSDVLVIGGGLAGLVTAIECLRAGKRVTLVDRDTRQRLGGQALWAFGGMALVDTPVQRRMKLKDSPERALRDWLRYGELDEMDVWPRQWAQYYVEHSREQVYDWVTQHGVKFLPAVNWVERGMLGNGNSLPRYHILWGTAQRFTQQMIAALHQANTANRLTLLSNHEVVKLESQGGVVTGAHAINHDTGGSVQFAAQAVVLAMGGINGSHEQVRANWPASRPLPATMLNGAHPFCNGKLHHLVAGLGGHVTHAGEMWNYAAGVPHPQPHFPGHGLSHIPCKSALWLDHTGRRIGPQPLITSFDTSDLCRTVAAQAKPYTWHLLNWRIAAKELALSGAEHNQRIRDRQFPMLMKEMLFGNHRLVRQMLAESRHFLVADTLAELAAKMNALAGTSDVRAEVLQQTADDFDANFQRGLSVVNDDQIRRIEHARHWPPERLRTCKPAPLQASGSGPFIAIQLQLITRKSLGGLKTDLQSRVLTDSDQAIEGLYCVGEAAGFGGGGACGKRSLEGTFLPGCVMTARAAARSINAGLGR
ncbi:MAG: FAD-dependent oxidoreductase [Rhodoferax sp.]|uniref:FAD-dependent oxidoreductase n=1 Tax=Rhodoferax sp. TaxID=50421 RepID=UPI001B47DB40|nr:FAD-dependent oxidoreductase [Rhodoferax sp.]MBP9737960.1 FAD-dependent oxidoreductase [Rhodoferax sp.]